MSVSAQSGLDRVREVWTRRRWLALAVTALALSLGLGVAMGVPDVYRATATVLVGSDEGAPDGGAPAELESRLHVVKEEMLSRAHAAGVVGRYRLYPELAQQGATELVLERFRRDVEVQLREVQEPGGRGRTVAVALGYRGPDPVVVANVTNSLAEAYLTRDARLRTRAASALQGQLDQVRAQVDAQERRLAEFRARHPGDLAARADNGLAALERLNGQLRAASEGRMRALERRSSLFRELGEAAPKPIDDPDATASRLAKLNQELTDLRQRYTDKYPDVQRAKAEIATLERQAAESRGRRSRPEPAASLAPRAASLQEALRETDAEIDALRLEETGLRRQVEEQRHRAAAAPRGGGGAATAQSLLELTRDYETTKAVYTSLLRRYEEARLAASEDREALQMRILEPAVPPTIPAAPNRLRLLLVAVVLALGAGLGAALLAEQLDGSFHSVEDVRGFTRVPVYGIPTLLTRQDVRRRRWRWGWRVAAVALAAVFLGQASYRLVRGDSAPAAASGGRS